MATTAWRLLLALTAAVGGLLTVALVAVPARAANRPGALAAQMVAGGYAVVGVVVGVLVALAALSARAIAGNTVLTTAYVWILGTSWALFGLAGSGTAATPQLGVWHFGGVHFLRQTYSLPGAKFRATLPMRLATTSVPPCMATSK